MAILAFTACGDDDNPTVDLNVLRYDGDNASSPALDAGTHELAVYFPASYLSDYIGKTLTQVEFYAAGGADSYKVVIHGPGTSTTPGPVIREEDVTSRVNSSNSNALYKQNLSTPLEITGEDIWIGMVVVHSSTLQTIGCDSGPRKNGGDWIWSADTQQWETFQQRTGSESVNWNIRGYLE